MTHFPSPSLSHISPPLSSLNEHPEESIGVATLQEAPLHAELGSLRLDSRLVSHQFIQSIPRDFARRHLVISQGEVEGCEQLVVAESSDPAAVFNIGVRLGRSVQPLIGDDEAIARLIDEVYGHEGGPDRADGESEAGLAASPGADIDRLLAEADRDLLSTQGKGPIIKLIDALLFEALGRYASDVHIQPVADGMLVRYRLDGVLHTVRRLPKHLGRSVISRIKVMGKMDIAERRIPQDGRASVNIGSAARVGPGGDSRAGDRSGGAGMGGRSIDLRISTLPTSHGERAVIRLLDNSHHLCDFAKLGMPPEVAGPYLERASRANGMILLTGPTGSGKTTTLYSTLRRIGSDALNIMTIEDPIEYELSSSASGTAKGMGIPDAEGKNLGGGISQSQVNTKKGVTFATGLRHILRQDPDVVMVGEIRDSETARIAIQSSLTGHLVFSTLHTNDAVSAVTRLMDLEIEPYLVSASLSAVLAQRLVRMFHQPCHGRGCEGCLKTGFQGRTGLFELLVVDEAIRELIGAHAALGEVRQAARALGMKTLKEDGDRLVALGLTSAVEVHRVVQGAI